jgi:hypothetical protein
MKKTYKVTLYYKAFDSDNDNIPSSIVVTASDEKDVLDFIKEKKKEIMKNDNWQSQFANDGVAPIINYEEIEIINL